MLPLAWLHGTGAVVQLGPLYPPMQVQVPTPMLQYPWWAAVVAAVVVQDYPLPRPRAAVPPPCRGGA